MKKIILITICFLSTASIAQQGSWYIGGNAGFSSRQFENNSNVVQKFSSWSFSPEIGTFLTNRLQLGLGITTNGSKQENINNNRENTLKFGGTLYTRYFFGETAFKPFVAINVTVLPGSVKYTDLSPNPAPSYTGDVFSFGANLNAGFAYALNPKFTAVGSFGLVGFNSNSYKVNGSEKSDSGIDANINTLGNRFTIGIYYTFKSAKE